VLLQEDNASYIPKHRHAGRDHAQTVVYEWESVDADPDER
jgi:hypothetical protein